MSGIVTFMSRPELDATENLVGFIAMCRDKLTVFGADLPFDDMVWDVTEGCSRKGHGKKQERITFCTMQSARTKSPIAMCAAFLPFAHAYIRYMQGMRPVVGLGFRVAALRALEAALTENGADLSPVKADSGIFNRAAQILKEEFSADAAYRIGMQLEMLAEFMANNRLTSVPLSWRNVVGRPLSGIRVGQEFDERRASKLPSSAALDAIPRAFRFATDPGDILVSSIAAMLCSAPDRVNEVLILPVDCEVRVPRREGKEEAYGIRWWPAKGAEPMVKWIVPSMSSVVQEALTRIRLITEDARRVATWYENNPNRLYLPAHLEHLRNRERLTLPEVGEVLWGPGFSRAAPRNWCTGNAVPLTKEENTVLVPFAELERAVVAMLPPEFPFLDKKTGLRYRDALCVVGRNLFHQGKATFVPAIQGINIQNINDGLGSRTEHGSGSIFDSLGLTEADGSPIRVTSHQFRHYLNTLAHAGGMSQLDIAKWSGRKDVRQNAAYNHVSAHAMVAKIRETIGDEEKMFGPLAALPKKIPITRDEFARLKVPTAHTTELGFCGKDFVMSPCQMHRDCINCGEHFFIKGDEVKYMRIQTQYGEAQMLLSGAECALKKGRLVAERWTEHHRLTVSRLHQVLELMDDPNIPHGSVIQLSNTQAPSRLRQAHQEQLGVAHSPPSTGRAALSAPRRPGPVADKKRRKQK